MSRFSLSMTVPVSVKVFRNGVSLMSKLLPSSSVTAIWLFDVIHIFGETWNLMTLRSSISANVKTRMGFSVAPLSSLRYWFPSPVLRYMLVSFPVIVAVLSSCQSLYAVPQEEPQGSEQLVLTMNPTCSMCFGTLIVHLEPYSHG